MLYILVVCAGSLCMPVESIGAYTLTRDDCEACAEPMRERWRKSE